MGRTLVDCQESQDSAQWMCFLWQVICYLQNFCKQVVVDVYNIWIYMIYEIYIYMLIFWHRKSMKSHWFQLFSSLVKQEKSWNFDRNNRCCWSTKFDEQIWTILGLAVEVFLWSLWFSRKNNWFSLIFLLLCVLFVRSQGSLKLASRKSFKSSERDAASAQGSVLLFGGAVFLSFFSYFKHLGCSVFFVELRQLVLDGLFLLRGLFFDGFSFPNS